MAPQLAEHVHGQFLGAGRVLDHADDDARDATVVGVKDGFEIERKCGFPGSYSCVSPGAHTLNNDAGRRFVT
jgi:hypothetical protein